MSLKERAIVVRNMVDVSKSILDAKIYAKAIGFDTNEQCMISTAVSELGTNIIRHAGEGMIVLRQVIQKGKKGIEIVSEDEGPGIVDIHFAMKDNSSTSNGLGIGLPGVKRLMGEISIDPSRQQGTKITVRKWL